MSVGRQASRLVLGATVLLLIAPSMAAAGKTPAHCRDVIFDGAAGAASNDKVTLRVVDKDGAILDESCKIQVKPLETAIEFGTRLPGAWGPGTGEPEAGPSPPPPCNPVPLPTPPAKPLNKTCGAGLNGHSCKHQWFFKQKTDGTITKKFLRICCYEGSECKGKKFGKELTIGKVPISLQTKIDPALVFAPEVPPEAGITLTPVALDPIGLTQQPSRDLQSCRALVGKTMAGVTATVAKALVDCHEQAMAGKPVGDCNSFADEKVAAIVAKVEAAVAAAVAKKCEPFGSPSTYGYGTCPAPCEGISVNVCTQGQIGSICTNDPSCDTTTGARDGRCGDWHGAARCLSCLAEEAVRAAVIDKYGDPGPGPGLPPGPLACQQAVGDALVRLTVALTKDGAVCQKKKDLGAVVLPEGVSSCKFVDLKGKREAAEAEARATILASCGDADVAALDICDPNATTASEAADCVVANGQGVAAATSDATFPEDRGAVPPPASCPAGTCGNYTAPCNPSFPAQCFCFATAEGGGFCGNDFACASAQDCPGGTETCPPGTACYVDTCCGGPKCGPSTCSGGPPTLGGGGGITAAGNQ